MESLGDEYRACSGEDVLVAEQRGPAQVGRRADTFEYTGKREERCHVSGGKAVCAFRNRLRSSRSYRVGEELDVLSFILSNELKILYVIGVKAEISELLLRKVLETLLVEDILEVFKSQGELKDSSIDVLPLQKLRDRQDRVTESPRE